MGLGDGGQTKGKAENLGKNLVNFSNWILRRKEKSYNFGNGIPGKKIKNLTV
jgi:hypothetical protein